MLFRGGQYDKETSVENNCLIVKETDEVETLSGWKKAIDVVVGDKFTDDAEIVTVVNIEVIDNMIKLFLGEEVMSV